MELLPTRRQPARASVARKAEAAVEAAAEREREAEARKELRGRRKNTRALSLFATALMSSMLASEAYTFRGCPLAVEEGISLLGVNARDAKSSVFRFSMRAESRGIPRIHLWE